jgi:hypothetical protein
MSHEAQLKAGLSIKSERSPGFQPRPLPRVKSNPMLRCSADWTLGSTLPRSNSDSITSTHLQIAYRLPAIYGVGGEFQASRSIEGRARTTWMRPFNSSENADRTRKHTDRGASNQRLDASAARRPRCRGDELSRCSRSGPDAAGQILRVAQRHQLRARHVEARPEDESH